MRFRPVVLTNRAGDYFDSDFLWGVDSVNFCLALAVDVDGPIFFSDGLDCYTECHNQTILHASYDALKIEDCGKYVLYTIDTLMGCQLRVTVRAHKIRLVTRGKGGVWSRGKGGVWSRGRTVTSAELLQDITLDKEGNNAA